MKPSRPQGPRFVAPTRRVIPGVLHNFIATFTSRYSDFGGYWLFGLCVVDLDAVTLDLLDDSPDVDDSTPWGLARSLAVQKFGEQIAKVGLPSCWIRKAHLDISKSPTPLLGAVNGYRTSGHIVIFEARVVTDLGREYRRKTSVFVAPHDPKMESRSSRMSAADR